ncbi:MAG: hypothetical protein KF732_02785 [Flavobacteriales bacterium]|nr:hypothetical protein [Flavobacteriales bacterium]MCB0380011.1 hypothetical protein [Flavobacteriales bacterium]MCB9173012.1 hypothetical protein [Flavobacteriales bacterium]
MIPELGLYDFVLAFLYLFIIYVFALFYIRIKKHENPEYKYFLWALSAKLFGGIFFALFSIYYYKGGDTFFYFNAAEGWVNYIIDNPLDNLKMLLSSEQLIDDYSFEHNYIYRANDVFTMAYNTILLTFIGLNSYLLTSILFAFTSFLGLWFGYSNLSKLYPNISKYLLIGFFFVPTAILWSSGILKDTVTQGIIGWLIYTVSNLFIFNRKKILSILILVIGAYILFKLKPYILYVLIPCFFIWIQSSSKELIKGSFIRIIILPILLVFLLISGYFLTLSFSESAGKYNLENIDKTLEGFQGWHTYLAETQDQSGYTLGDMDFTPLGMLSIAPAALNVTFFRPYLWEVRNLPTLLGAFEGLVLFIFFLYLVIKLRLRLFILLFKSKEAFFMMLFAIIFGVVVGISSYNFGALSRYKIPAEMFFITSLIIVYYKSKEQTN